MCRGRRFGGGASDSSAPCSRLLLLLLLLLLLRAVFPTAAAPPRRVRDCCCCCFAPCSRLLLLLLLLRAAVGSVEGAWVGEKVLFALTRENVPIFILAPRPGPGDLSAQEGSPNTPAKTSNKQASNNNNKVPSF